MYCLALKILTQFQDLNVIHDSKKVLEDSFIDADLHPDFAFKLVNGSCTTTNQNEHCYSVDIVLSRKITNHILHVYLPSWMLSMAAFMSLFIPANNMAARMGLSTSTTLSSIVLFVGAK